jgi:hypothetical protein
MFVYPKPGLLIRDPEKRDLIPESGREVGAGDLYWIRRVADGDVTTTPPASALAPRASGKGAAPTVTDPGSNDA